METFLITPYGDDKIRISSYETQNGRFFFECSSDDLMKDAEQYEVELDRASQKEFSHGMEA